MASSEGYFPDLPRFDESLLEPDSNLDNEFQATEDTQCNTYSNETVDDSAYSYEASCHQDQQTHIDNLMKYDHGESRSLADGHGIVASPGVFGHDPEPAYSPHIGVEHAPAATSQYNQQPQANVYQHQPGYASFSDPGISFTPFAGVEEYSVFSDWGGHYPQHTIPAAQQAVDGYGPIVADRLTANHTQQSDQQSYQHRSSQEEWSSIGPGNYGNDIPAFRLDLPGDEAPWSPENPYCNRTRGLVSHVNHLVNQVNHPQARRISNVGDSNSDLIRINTSFAISTGGSDTYHAQGQEQSSASAVATHEEHPTSDGYPTQIPRDVVATEYHMSMHRSSSAQASFFRVPDQHGGSSRNNSHNYHLPPVSIPQALSVTQSSRSNSTISEVLQCPICGTEFTGIYRKGNWGRHCRQKHKRTVETHPCEAGDCQSAFQRKDARLKHYRKHHPRLAQGQAMPRK